MSSRGFFPVTSKTSSADLLDDLRPGVVALVHPVAEALQPLPALTALDRGDEVGDVLDAADVGQHPDDGLVGPTVAGAVERGRRGGGGRVGIGMRRAHHPHGRRRAILLVVGMQDEQHIEGVCQHGIRLVAGLGHLPEHGEEVVGEVERVVRVDEGHAHAEAVGRRGQGRHLGDQADDLLPARFGIEDLLGVEVERREGGDGRYQHAHRMGVVVEALEEALADVLVNEGVVGDLVAPGLELRRVRELPVQEEVGHLQVGGVLSQLLDGIAPVAQNAGVAVEVGDGALAGRRRHERRGRRTRRPEGASTTRWQTPRR